VETFAIVAELLLVGLRMWEHHEKEKYTKLVLEMKRERYEEEGKPVVERDQAKLDYYDHELLILSRRFLKEVSQHDKKI